MTFDTCDWDQYSWSGSFCEKSLAHTHSVVPASLISAFVCTDRFCFLSPFPRRRPAGPSASRGPIGRMGGSYWASPDLPVLSSSHTSVTLMTSLVGLVKSLTVTAPITVTAEQPDTCTEACTGRNSLCFTPVSSYFFFMHGFIQLCSKADFNRIGPQSQSTATCSPQHAVAIFSFSEGYYRPLSGYYIT